MVVTGAFAAFALVLSAARAVPTSSDASYANAFKEVSISSPDGSIKANYIHLGENWIFCIA